MVDGRTREPRQGMHVPAVVHDPGGVGIEGCECCKDEINGMPSEEM
jgi:hypothetical protein